MYFFYELELNLCYAQFYMHVLNVSMQYIATPGVVRGVFPKFWTFSYT